MKTLYDWLKERWRASQAVTCETPRHRPPPPRGRPVGGLTETDYLLLLMSTRSWP
jgi:hypothetical protein